MTYPIYQIPEAEINILNALEWYASQRVGLDDDFLLSLEAELNSILRNPFLYASLHKQTRRALMARFPYAVFFIVEETEILILAVVHQRRKPSVWKMRKAKF